jgi:hypothetical protein
MRSLAGNQLFAECTRARVYARFDLVLCQAHL